MPKVLLVEDDEKVRNELKIFLNKNGYEVININNFENVIEEILKVKVDLILLDINLPNVDGQYILKEVRKTSDVPIIMLTSMNTDLDELISMNYGADGYITKPFNMQILLARINALLKRSLNFSLDQEKINCGKFILNISKSIIEKENINLELTKNELKILEKLVKNKGKIVSREEIINYLWDNENFVDDNTLTVNITRLKNKLEEIGLKDIIETKRGQGYILNEF